MSIENIRTTLVRTAREWPSTGPDYIELLNRTRRWMLDLAESMLPIHASVSTYGMELNVPFIEHVIGLARAEAEKPYEEYSADIKELHQAISQIALEVREAFHFEEVSEYSSAWSASRAALQAILTAISTPDDFDIFSITNKAVMVAEQCALAQAYHSLAQKNNSGQAASKDVATELATARKEHGWAYYGTLNCRIFDNVPGSLDIEEKRKLSGKPA